MSEEQKIENQEQVQEVKEPTAKKPVATVLSIVALVVSLIALGFSLFAVFNGGATGGGDKAVVISKQYDKGQSLEKAIKKDKPMIVFFYTDWCGFCQKFVPTFHQVTKDKKIKKNFAIAYVNCEVPENRAYMEEYNVNAFPTVFVVDGDKKVHLDNATFFTTNAKQTIVKNSLAVLDEDDDDKK